MNAPLCIQDNVTVHIYRLRFLVGPAVSILLRVPSYKVISFHGKRTLRRNDCSPTFLDFNGCWNISNSTIGIVCNLVRLGIHFLVT